MLEGWIIDASNGSMTSVPSAMAVRISRSDRIKRKLLSGKGAHYALRPGGTRMLEGLPHVMNVGRQPIQTPLVPHQERAVDQAADDESDPCSLQQPEPEDDREEEHDQERDPRVRVADIAAQEIDQEGRGGDARNRNEQVAESLHCVPSVAAKDRHRAHRARSSQIMRQAELRVFNLDPVGPAL